MRHFLTKESTKYGYIKYLEDGEYDSTFENSDNPYDATFVGCRLKGQVDLIRYGSSFAEREYAFIGAVTGDIIYERYKGSVLTSTTRGNALKSVIYHCYEQLQNDVCQLPEISDDTLALIEEFKKHMESFNSNSCHSFGDIEILADKYILLQDSVRRDLTNMMRKNQNDDLGNRKI